MVEQGPDNVVYMEDYRDPVMLTPEQRAFWHQNRAHWKEQQTFARRADEYATRQLENADRMLGQLPAEKGLGQRAVRHLVSVDDKEDLW